ncbi:TPA: hypothetical protein ACSY4A_02515 [Listeria monocytogenes]|nr:hypothetical protein [Listeria monocytogenes]EHP2950350.1 hypothetical protein [Listeria monocytogenes]EHP3117698.1 hypothetical protein [Listeria monocytogenes]
MQNKKKKTKINYKKFFPIITSIISVIFPIIITLYIFDYDKSNSPVVIEDTTISLYRLNGAEFPVKMTPQTGKNTYCVSANLSIDVKCEQGTVENAYYIFPTTEGKINTSSFNHVNNLSNYVHEIIQLGSTFYQIIPFYLLLIDKEQNLTINYYHVVTNSTINAHQIGDQLEFSSFDLEPTLFTINYYDLISDKVFEERNKEIINLLKKNKDIDLNQDAAQIDMEKTRNEVKQIKNIYKDFYSISN